MCDHMLSPLFCCLLLTVLLSSKSCYWLLSCCNLPSKAILLSLAYELSAHVEGITSWLLSNVFLLKPVSEAAVTCQDLLRLCLQGCPPAQHSPVGVGHHGRH